jgi:hypothetical protein
LEITTASLKSESHASSLHKPSTLHEPGMYTSCVTNTMLGVEAVLTMQQVLGDSTNLERSAW